jgi:SAM-dependent methyltransferase
MQHGPLIPTQLNLGCGRFPKPGFLNVDKDERSGADRLMDLDRLPYDLPTGHFTRIEADHVLEHLSDPLAVMAELHRLLQPGGALVLRVPHFSRGFSHWDHKRGFDHTFAYYFRPEWRGGYTGLELELVSCRLRWFTQPELKRTVLGPVSYALGALTGRVLDVAANLSPAACSRGWCFWVGGFEEIEFVFRKPAA